MKIVFMIKQILNSKGETLKYPLYWSGRIFTSINNGLFYHSFTEVENDILLLKEKGEKGLFKIEKFYLNN